MARTLVQKGAVGRIEPEPKGNSGRIGARLEASRP
jgi:hypothetical protein